MGVIGNIIVRMGVDLSSFESGLKKAQKSLEKTSKTLSSIGDSFTRGITVPVAAAGAGLTALTVSAGKTADELLELSAKTGIGTKTLQEMKYASELVDVSLEDMTDSMFKMTKSMDAARDAMNAGKLNEQAKAYQALNVNIRNADGSLRDSKAVWYEVIDSLGKVKNETERNAIAFQIFGKSAMELNPLITAGGQRLKELGEEAQKAGVIMSEESINSLGAFDDSIQRIKASLEAGKMKIAAAFVPALQQIAPVIEKNLVPAFEKVGKAISDAISWFNNLSDGQKKLVGTMTLVAVGVGPVLTGLGKMASGFSAAVGAVKLLGGALTFLMANPVVLAITAIAIAIGGIAIACNTASRETKKLTADIIAAAERQKNAELDAIAKAFGARQTAIAETRSSESAAYAERIAKIDAAYQKDVEASNKAKETAINNINERKSKLQEEYNANIQKIRDEYGYVAEKTLSKTDIVNRFYDGEISKATEAYNEKVRLINLELAERLKEIDAYRSAEIKKRQDKIDAINEEAKNEQDAKRDSKLLDRKSKLEGKIAAETDVNEKAALLEELAGIEEEIAQNSADKEREIAIKATNDEIEQIDRATTHKKQDAEGRAANSAAMAEAEKINQEYLSNAARDTALSNIKIEQTEKEKAEEAKFNAASKRLTDELTAIDGWLPKYQERLNTELAKKKKLEEDKYNAFVKRLDDEEKELKRREEAEANRAKSDAQAKIDEAEENAGKFENSVAGQFVPSGSTDDWKPVDTDKMKKWWSGILDGVGLPSYAVGTSYVPHDMVAQIHKGEAIIPAAQNRGGQSADTQLMRQQNALLAEQNQLLRQIAEKDPNFILDGDKVNNTTQRGNARRGYNTLATPAFLRP